MKHAKHLKSERALVSSVNINTDLHPDIKEFKILRRREKKEIKPENIEVDWRNSLAS